MVHEQADGAGHSAGSEVAPVAPLQGTVVLLPFTPGDSVPAGAIVVVLRSMKLEHVVRAPVAGILGPLGVVVGGLVTLGDPLGGVETGEAVDGLVAAIEEVDVDHIRADLAERFVRRRLLTDAGRPDVLERRHSKGRRTARENFDDVIDTAEFGRQIIEALRACPLPLVRAGNKRSCVDTW